MYRTSPPIIKQSTLFSKDSITSIFPEIFAPPMIAVSGLDGLLKHLFKERSSVFNKKPQYFSLKKSATPLTEEWLR